MDLTPETKKWVLIAARQSLKEFVDAAFEHEKHQIEATSANLKKKRRKAENFFDRHFLSEVHINIFKLGEL